MRKSFIFNKLSKKYEVTLSFDDEETAKKFVEAWESLPTRNIRSEDIQ